MAAATQPVPALLSLEEYLHTTYRPDCDFVDDHIEERNLGELQHSLLQSELSYWFRLHRTEWNIRVMSELRTLVTASRVRIPDVMVALNDAAMKDKIRLQPPLIAIEIISPEDRLSRVLPRLEDFRLMGVPNIWLLDPDERVGYTYSEGGLRLIDRTRIEVPNSPIYLDLPELFAALD